MLAQGRQRARWSSACILVALSALGCDKSGPAPQRASAPAPVAVAPLERGPIALRRTYSGTLEAPARFIIAAKQAGQIETLTVDLGDRVKRGQQVAQLDADEFRQLTVQARAELAVARANLAAAQSARTIGARDLERLETLRGRGVASESQLDAARAGQLAQSAAIEVATAGVARAQAALDAAKIRLGYATLTADWTGGSDERVVGERFVNPGATVSANAPLLSIVELDPITAVIFVAERDYRHLAIGQSATLRTDTYPGEDFRAAVVRIAPVFQPESRQARVELGIENADHRLKPGMFVRATVVLRALEAATIAPQSALTQREGETGVFLLDPAGKTAVFRKVEVGIREGERVELIDFPPSGRVVTLGQQLLDDGAPVVVPASGDAR